MRVVMWRHLWRVMDDRNVVRATVATRGEAVAYIARQAE